MGEGEEGPRKDPGRGAVVTKATVGSIQRLDRSFRPGRDTGSGQEQLSSFKEMGP